MNLFSRILTLVVLLGVTIHFAACDGGDDKKKSEKEEQIDKLVGTWKASAVSYDGDDVTTPDYTNFQITISKASADAMTFTTSGRPGKLTPWDASGTFTFGTPVASRLVRGDQVEIAYTVNNSSLTFVMENYSGDGYQGRTETVAGDWEFVMVKQ